MTDSIVLEEWKDIPDYEGLYQASSLGRIKSVARVVAHARMGKKTIPEKILKQTRSKNALVVRLSNRDGGTLHLVSRIVARTFLGEISHADILHADGDQSNNSVANLVARGQPMNIDGEVWKPIPGFDGYEASSMGRVRGIDRLSGGKHQQGRVLSSFVDSGGREGVALRKHSRTVPMRVHRLVAMAFWADQSWAEVDHIDCNPRNNALSNLRPASRQQNMANSRSRNPASGLKGAYRTAGGMWRSTITVGGKYIHLGVFCTSQEAHAAYCDAARKHYGEFARFD